MFQGLRTVIYPAPDLQALLPSGRSGPYSRAARAYDRAYRVPEHRQVARRGPGADLTLAALGLGLATSAKSPSAIERIALMASLKMLLEVVADIRVAQVRSEAARAARAAAQQLQAGVDEVLPPTMPALHREGLFRQAELFGTAAERLVRTGVDSATAQRPERPSRGR